jgi:ligand-binding sensor domain-containing protein/signal transduction histidine kinase/DNA-binding response OmpR family regulator
MTIKKIFIYLFIISFPLFAQYQDLRFNHITTENGLSKSSVTCILQDKQGFIWVGTFNGLNRYDGYNFAVYQYNQNDQRSLSHNYISSILEDDKGQLWVGTSDGLNCYDRLSDSFKRYRYDKNKPGNISDNQIEVIFQDKSNQLWVGTRNKGLNLFNPQTETFIHYYSQKDNSNSLSSNFIQTIFEDSKGNLWIGHRNGAVDLFDKKGKKFIRLSFNGKPLSYFAIRSIAESPDGNIWLGTQGIGVIRIKYENGKVFVVKQYLHTQGQQNSIAGNIILSLMVDRHGKLWIGTEDEGLDVLDIQHEKFYSYKTDPLNHSSINNNSIYTIYEDSIGNIWIGTFAGGLNLVTEGRAYFQYVRHLPGNANSLSNNNINGFWEDSDGNLWIATNGGGLELFDRKNKKFIHYSSNSAITADVILSLYEDSDQNLWVGTWANGLYKFNRKTKQITQYTKEKNGLGDNNIFQIVEGQKGELWLCTFWGGLTRFDVKTQSSQVYNTDNSKISDNDLRAITKDYQGNLWIGNDVGLDFFNPITKEFKSYKHRENDNNSISKGFVSYVFESRDLTLWICTTSGLNKFDRKKKSFVHYNTKQGLPNDEIMCIIEDNRGYLWISTNKGISRFDPKAGTFRNYDVSDGLQGNEYNTRSGLKTKKGEIVFGGVNGFNIFQPENIKDNPFIPPVIINDLKIFNKSVAIGEKDSPLEKNITETREIVFQYWQSVFSFSFVALNYVCPEKNKYAYMMEGFDRGWNYVGSSRTATYTNLDPGSYTFKVKATNNDGLWNEKGTSIKVIIEPPFWKTWWAYFIETILVFLIIYFIADYYISRQRLRNSLKMEHLELEKMYELDQMKTQFFSNISHEFHSPMTLILSPLEKLISSSIDEKIKNSLMLILRNAKRLQRMTSQLKDLNKLDTGDLRLSLSKGDLIRFIKEICHSFQDYAKDHHIDFHFESNKEQCLAWFDSDKLDKIIYNLLSNAFKFTPDGKNIEVTISVVDLSSEKISDDEKEKPAQYVEIKVKDTGIGIPQDKIDLIFKRFYHLEDYDGRHFEGSGVGLAFVIELLKIYKGEISVESVEGKGTTFTIQIPIDEHYLEEHQLVSKFKISSGAKQAALITGASLDADNPEIKKNKVKSSDVSVVLIVEDDQEIRNYIKKSFEINYRVHEAEDGSEGFETAVQIIPDLIVTDIKMREVDGITLCKQLKNDERTSHIPIIMLTSYSSKEYEIRGLAEGADAYLTKPFNIDVLEAHIVNLLESRKKLQEKFSSEFVLGPSKIPLTNIDEKFLNQLTEIVEKHMSDNKFNADILSEKIGLSRMQLYRKLRGLTNQTVHEFIRNIRLKRAVQLLELKRMTITEVAYEVGFNDLTYFARCFRKQYDKSPSEYVSNKS